MLSLDQSVRGGVPVGTLLPRERLFPERHRRQSQQRQVLVLAGRERNHLLATRWQVEVRPSIVTEQTERPRGGHRLGLPFLRFGYLCRDLGHVRIGQTTAHFGHLHRQHRGGLPCGLDGLADLRRGPALLLGVGQIPACWHPDRELHQERLRQVTLYGQGGADASLVGVRPDDHLPTFELRPVRKVDGLRPASPRHADDVRHQPAGGVARLFALDDQHRLRRELGEQVRTIQRARTCHGLEPPALASVLMLAPAHRDDLLPTVRLVVTADDASPSALTVLVRPDHRRLPVLVMHRVGLGAIGRRHLDGLPRVRAALTVTAQDVGLRGLQPLPQQVGQLPSRLTDLQRLRGRP